MISAPSCHGPRQCVHDGASIGADARSDRVCGGVDGHSELFARGLGNRPVKRTIRHGIDVCGVAWNWSKKGIWTYGKPNCSHRSSCAKGVKHVARHEEQEESLFEAPPMAEQERMVEAILFATAEPVTVKDLSARMPHGCDPRKRWCMCANAMRGAV